MFIASIVKSSTFAAKPDNSMLGPTEQGLQDLGAIRPLFWQRNEIERAVASPFMFSGLIDLIIALFIQIHFGFPWERDWGTQQVVALWITGGINASVTSSICFETRTSVVGTGALASLLGAKLGQLLISWHKTSQQTRTMSVIMLVFAMVALIALGQTANHADNCGNIGGWIVGICLSFAIFQDEIPEDRRVYRKLLPIGGRLTLAAFVILEIVWLVQHARSSTT